MGSRGEFLFVKDCKPYMDSISLRIYAWGEVKDFLWEIKEVVKFVRVVM